MNNNYNFFVLFNNILSLVDCINNFRLEFEKFYYCVNVLENVMINLLIIIVNVMDFD